MTIIHEEIVLISTLNDSNSAKILEPSMKLIDNIARVTLREFLEVSSIFYFIFRLVPPKPKMHLDGSAMVLTYTTLEYNRKNQCWFKETINERDGIQNLYSSNFDQRFLYQ